MTNQYYIYLTNDEALAVAQRREGNRASTKPPRSRVDPESVLPLKRGEYAFILRRRAGLALRDVAERLGVSAMTVGNWERGAQGNPEPEIEYLEKELKHAIRFYPAARRPAAK